jgi:hypothetical protein
MGRCFLGELAYQEGALGTGGTSGREEDSQWICLEASLCAVVQLGGWSPQLTGVVCLQEGAAGGCLPERKDV